MDQSLAIRNIKTSLRILNVLLIATIVIVSSCILLLFGLFVVALTVSGEKISKLVLDSNIDISFKFNGMTIFLNKDIMSNFVYDKSEAIILILLLMIFTLIFLSIFINYTATPLKTLINIDPVGSIVIWDKIWMRQI